MSEIYVSQSRPNPVIKIINSVFNFMPYTERNEVLRVAQAMAKTALANETYSQEVKDAYVEAFKQIQNLTFEEMQEIIRIICVPRINPDDDDDTLPDEE